MARDTPEHYSLIGGPEYGSPLEGEKNTGICWKYVLHWGLRELFRELIQNLIDQVHCEAGSYCNHCSQTNQQPRLWEKGPCELLGHKKTPTGSNCVDCAAPWRSGPCELAQHRRMTAREVECTSQNGTDFFWNLLLPSQPPLTLGRIIYDPEGQQLVLSNKGCIPMEGILMGGGVKAGAYLQHDIAGRFGEGLKLAILSALRERKPISVKTAGLLWQFAFRWDAVFDQYCVFFNSKTHGEDIPPEWTFIQIDQISRESWVSNPVENIGVHCFLTLRSALGEDQLPIRASNPALGSLLLGSNLLGCLFVKGIFVTRPTSNNFPYQFGYNLVEVDLDRDRHHTVNFDQFKHLTASLIAHVLDNRAALLAEYPAANQFDLMIQKIHDANERTSWETWFLPNYLRSVEVYASLITRWRQVYNIPITKMPEHASCHLTPLALYGMSSEMYPTVNVNHLHFGCFKKAPQPLYEDVLQCARRLSQATKYPEGLTHPHFLKARTLLLPIFPALANATIFFVRLDYQTNYQIDNVVYLSEMLLDPAWVTRHEGGNVTPVHKIMIQLALLLKIPLPRVLALFLDASSQSSAAGGWIPEL